MQLHRKVGSIGWLGALALSVLASFGGPARADLLPPPGAKQAPELPDAELATVRKVDDGHFELGRALFNRLVKNPQAAGVNILPAIRNGKRLGYSLFGIRRGLVAEKLGLLNGDMVTAVNGISLAEAKPAELAAKLNGASHVTLQLNRKGLVLTLEYEIKG